ncbi:putative membrane protein [Wickerhamomyces ciferrii]|uniref:Membrane protein n=1 Tax=Wickerhamomyces ciferrii (strain ATCC 14091 / BCRC 22168 / CBS 111 / JCM 3599 / NBRC 0793 / NRRL Y-1031 F-60-10) TaxID=1206466 RepID=K0KP80_WICCF|nr:uncharacterized protein BN7_6694 [Wickerhamomyces ciferrii]CCH47085.1 putative membrane protein [Wickerhamomyces ciferrii]
MVLVPNNPGDLRLGDQEQNHRQPDPDLPVNRRNTSGGLFELMANNIIITCALFGLLTCWTCSLVQSLNSPPPDSVSTTINRAIYCNYANTLLKGIKNKDIDAFNRNATAGISPETLEIIVPLNAIPMAMCSTPDNEDHEILNYSYENEKDAYTDQVKLDETLKDLAKKLNIRIDLSEESLFSGFNSKIVKKLKQSFVIKVYLLFLLIIVSSIIFEIIYDFMNWEFYRLQYLFLSLIVLFCMTLVLFFI